MTDLLKHLPIKDITKNPYQPRLHFNETELEELAQSISENGLIQPIIVRPSDIIGYELIAGERRLRASQLAGLTTIPAIIKDVSADDSMKQAIIENLQRQNLNPVEEAKAYQRLMLNNHMTHDDIAKSMGKSRPYITNAIRLLHLPSPILTGLEQGELSSGHARLLLSLPDDEQKLSWYRTIKTDSLSVRQLERRLKAKSTPSQDKNTFHKDYEKQLQQALGLEVHITANHKHQGKVSISFQNQDDFHRLMEQLLNTCE